MEHEIKCSCLPNDTIINSNYLIQKTLAASNLSLVYLAFDQKRRQTCAIKEFFPTQLVLRDLDHLTVLTKQPSLKDKFSRATTEFFNEALILKTVRHRNITKYRDHFTVNNTGYLVVEYYKGPTLEQYIKAEKNISLRNFLRNYFIPILDAVAALHKFGVIHRDLKPNNIIITKENQPMLIDFGSAVRINDPGKKKIFVTPGFSPLEFYAENSRQGSFSDLYSLAATLYYYLCGRVPLEVTQRLFEDNLEDIKKYNEIISSQFAKTIMRNLAIDSHKRFKSVKRLKRIVYWETFLKRTI
jgi:serine/threonine protein kinase